MSCTLEQSNEFARKLYLWRRRRLDVRLHGHDNISVNASEAKQSLWGTMDCFVASLLAMRARRAHRRRPPRRHRPRRRTIEYAAASRFDQRHLRLLDARLRGHDGELLRGRPALSATSPRLRGEVGFYAKRKIRVRGLSANSDVETAPHPSPLRASFARLDPAKSGAREHTVPTAPRPALRRAPDNRCSPSRRRRRTWPCPAC
jgi:hypothetical protein